MAVKMSIVAELTPPFCPRKENWLNDCPRQLRIAKNSRNLFDLKEACMKCKMESLDTKTNPQDHPISRGRDLFQNKDCEVIQA